MLQHRWGPTISACQELTLIFLAGRMLSLFLLMACMLILLLAGLAVMRGDTARLVLGPLRRMLKIVVRCKSLLLWHAVSCDVFVTYNRGF